MTYYFNVLNCPVGPITTAVDESGGVAALWFIDSHRDKSLLEFLAHAGMNRCVADGSRTAEVDRQVTEYFDRKRKDFDVRLAANGTAFQKAVWEELVKIPYGETRSYGELAKILGTPNASRAVGRANATNPIALIVPCHRVIGSNGSLTGYAGGLAIKEQLLAFESQDVGLFASV
jgi:methylated-DNA-[protein]-cysteine S-methyltransferase